MRKNFRIVAVVVRETGYQCPVCGEFVKPGYRCGCGTR